MILTVDMLCIMGVGSVLALIYCGILVFNNKYDGLLEPLNSKEYPLCETYNVGFYLINKIPRLIQNAHVRSKRQYIEILHGAKYADYYLRINSAQSLSLSLLVFVLSFFVYGLTAEPVVLVVMFVMAFFPLIIYLVSLRLIPIIFLFGFSLPAYASAMLYNKFFQKLEDQLLSEQEPAPEVSPEEDERVFHDEIDESIKIEDK